MAHVNHHDRTVKTTALVAYCLFFTGLVVVLLSVIGAEKWNWAEWVVHFIRDIGLLLSAVMAGTILHEKLLRDEMFERVEQELDAKLEAKIPKLSEIASNTAATVHALFCERPPQMTGIRLLSEVRRDFSGYYRWVNERRPQDLFFAGRSVLHRIDADIKGRIADSSADEILFRRLKEGSKIRILFLDPRTTILDRLAREEGQTARSMLGDIEQSISICHRLYERLVNDKNLRGPASLMVRVYDQIPYFAYHKQDDERIIGFYFRSAVGHSSGAYEIIDDESKHAFGGHFDGIMSDAAAGQLLEWDGSRREPQWNESLFEQLRQFLSEHLQDNYRNDGIGSHSASAKRMTDKQHDEFGAPIAKTPK